MHLQSLNHKHQRGVHPLLAARVLKVIIPFSHAARYELQLRRVFAELALDGKRDARCNRNAEQYSHDGEHGPGQARLPRNFLRTCRCLLTALHIVLHKLVKIARKSDEVSSATGEQRNGAIRIALARQTDNFFAGGFLRMQLGHDIAPQFIIHRLTSLLTDLNQCLIGLGMMCKLLEGTLDAVAVLGDGDFIRMRSKRRQIGTGRIQQRRHGLHRHKRRHILLIHMADGVINTIGIDVVHAEQRQHKKNDAAERKNQFRGQLHEYSRSLLVPPWGQQ